MTSGAHPFIGIDWGTTHRRAYLLGEHGAVEGEQHDDQGGLAVQGRFAESFTTLVAAWPQQAPVLLSGMVGSASGWQEVAYLDAGTPLATVSRHLVPLRNPPDGRRIYIVPGVRWRGTQGEVDVMRGEETQLLGALALGHGDGWYVLPGTHSKWVCVAQGAVTVLRTYMTGELFALLGRHGTLAPLVGDHDDPAAYLAGLRAAPGGSLSQTLFGCRARVVAGEMPAAQARSYLSGLLIGAEWADAMHRPAVAPSRVTLVAGPQLVAPYQTAARENGCELQVLDPREVHLAALRALREGLPP